MKQGEPLCITLIKPNANGQPAAAQKVTSDDITGIMNPQINSAHANGQNKGCTHDDHDNPACCCRDMLPDQKGKSTI